ncbi:hypothetical protein C2G38_696340 [Gigaspora rosea]|uniref:Uncharacterized protein n=1 Tax=Gigaspora rosea TaxID=44941 RepID=A0A397U3L9_9GLOM|nr:hypothetical protein C2G38_696340 [Gigaspora rosea]
MTIFCNDERFIIMYSPSESLMKLWQLKNLLTINSTNKMFSANFFYNEFWLCRFFIIQILTNYHVPTIFILAYLQMRSINALINNFYSH